MATLTKRQFAEKSAELENLARSIDLWSATPMSKEKSDAMGELYAELNEKLSEMDCAYLEKKLEYFQKIYKLLKDE